jgi:hypothetical protein
LLPDKYNPVYQKASPRKKIRIERAWIISSMLNEGQSIADIANTLKLSELRVKNLAFEFGIQPNPQGGGKGVRITANADVAKALALYAEQTKEPLSVIATRIVREAITDPNFFKKHFGKSVLKMRFKRTEKPAYQRREIKPIHLSQSQQRAHAIAIQRASRLWGEVK